MELTKNRDVSTLSRTDADPFKIKAERTLLGLMKGDRGRSKLQRKKENKGSSELPANWFWFYKAVRSHFGV